MEDPWCETAARCRRSAGAPGNGQHADALTPFRGAPLHEEQVRFHWENSSLADRQVRTAAAADLFAWDSSCASSRIARLCPCCRASRTNEIAAPYEEVIVSDPSGTSLGILPQPFTASQPTPPHGIGQRCFRQWPQPEPMGSSVDPRPQQHRTAHIDRLRPAGSPQAGKDRGNRSASRPLRRVHREATS